MKDAKVYPIFSKPLYVNNIDYDVKNLFSIKKSQMDKCS